jgi:hypothetical protein
MSKLMSSDQKAQSHAREVSEQPMSAAQAKYLKSLSQEAGEPFDPSLSAADAAKLIVELQEKTGRKPPVILLDRQTDG